MELSYYRVGSTDSLEIICTFIDEEKNGLASPVQKFVLFLLSEENSIHYYHTMSPVDNGKILRSTTQEKHYA